MARKKRSSKKKRFGSRRKNCRFCENPSLTIDYKDVRLMKQFVTDRGKIVARRVSGNCSKHQRSIARAVKRARFLALVPYKVDIYR